MAAFAANEFAPEKAPGYYPPALTGMRGNHDGSFPVAHRVRDGEAWDADGAPLQTGELYDLVVVGGGISGLAAAHFFRKKTGPNSRILILDNHDDFGGHAKRNEFHYQGKTFIGCGGTLGIATPFPYSYAAKALVKDLGIEAAE